MEPTGERLVPDASDPDVRNEHFARYRFAEPLAAGKRVLDAGCGVGYGAAMLAEAGGEVFALDSSAEAVASGREGQERVRFVRGDCQRLPFADDSFDLVVAFEVIEHVARGGDLLRESARVLTPSGVLLVSTPNRLYYQQAREEANPFHVREYDYEEFRTVLESTFRHCSIFLENHAPAITLTRTSQKHGRAMFESAARDPDSAHFFVGVCSNRAPRSVADFAYLPDSGNVLRERELHIAKLRRWVGDLESRHAEVEGNMSRELSRLPYRILRKLRLAPRLPKKWSK